MALERTIEPDHLYVMDRGYAKFALFNRIALKKSSYVCRNAKTDSQPDHKIRLICIQTTPHTSRGKYRGGSTGPGSDGVLRIATNLLDVPVEIISLIYRFRWTTAGPDPAEPRMITMTLHRPTIREWMRSALIHITIYTIFLEIVLRELAAAGVELRLTTEPNVRQQGRWILGPFGGNTLAEWEVVLEVAQRVLPRFNPRATVDAGSYRTRFRRPCVASATPLSSTPSHLRVVR